MKQLLIFTLFCCLLACSQKPAAVKKYYRISPDVNHATYAPQKEATLWVKRPEAYGILGNRPMVAVDVNGALQQLSYHSWLESPKIMLQAALAEAAKPFWETVTTDKPSGFEHHTFKSQITAFEKNQNQAVITLKITITDPDGTQSNQQVHATQVISEQDYAAFVSAMNAAITDILKRLEW